MAKDTGRSILFIKESFLENFTKDDSQEIIGEKLSPTWGHSCFDCVQLGADKIRFSAKGSYNFNRLGFRCMHTSETKDSIWAQVDTSKKMTKMFEITEHIM